MSKDSELPRIKVGQKLKTRSGEVVTVTKDDGGEMPYFTSAGFWHYPNGRVQREGIDPRDLVELIEDAEAPFNPLAARDRIKEIDVLRAQLDTERAQLIEDLRQAGFELVANGRYEPPKDVPEPKDWKEGDVVECIAKAPFFYVGNEYQVFYDGIDSDGNVRICDGDADYHYLDPEHFRWLRRPE